MGKTYWEKFKGKIYGENLRGNFTEKIRGENLRRNFMAKQFLFKII